MLVLILWLIDDIDEGSILLNKNEKVVYLFFKIIKISIHENFTMIAQM